MKKLLIVIAFIALAVLAAPYLIPADALKSQLIAKLEAATGKKIVIAGHFGITLFPSVGVQAEKVSILEPLPAGAADYKQIPLADIQSLKIDVALMPLLHKEIQLQSAKVADANVEYNQLGITHANFTIVPAANSSLAMDGDMTWKDKAVRLKSQLEAPQDCLQTKHCHFSNVALKLGNIDAKGDIKLNVAGTVPVIEIMLSTPALDLTEFLPPQKQAARGWLIGNALADSSGWSKEPIDLSFLRRFNAKVNIDADSVRVYDVKLGKTTLKAELIDKILTVNMPDFECYGGKGLISAVVDVRGAEPRLERGATLKGIDLGAFLKDAVGYDRFSGKADINSAAGTRGNSMHDFISALQGTGSVKVRDGAIKGYNIADMVRNVQSAFKDVDTSARQTDFSELSGTFTINNGIVANNDLSMLAPLFRLTGAGTVNLPEQTLQYRLTPQFIDTLKGQDSGKQGGIGVPVIVEGSLDHPTFRPDVRAVVEDVMKNPDAYKEKAKEAKEAIKGLKDIFKKKKPAPTPAP